MNTSNHHEQQQDSPPPSYNEVVLDMVRERSKQKGGINLFCKFCLGFILGLLALWGSIPLINTIFCYYFPSDDCI